MRGHLPDGVWADADKQVAARMVAARQEWDREREHPLQPGAFAPPSPRLGENEAPVYGEGVPTPTKSSQGGDPQTVQAWSCPATTGKSLRHAAVGCVEFSALRYKSRVRWGGPGGMDHTRGRS